MKICTIDIGTNTILYLLSKIDRRENLIPIAFKSKTTRLGTSLKKNNIIPSAIQKRSVAAVKSFINHAKKNNADRYIIAGTSALREAKNSQQFRNLVFKETNKKIKILSGIEEAKTTFLAVNNSIKIKKKNTIVIDIGGGSTEIIFSKSKKTELIYSLPIGAVHLTEKYKDDLESIALYTKNKLKKIKRSILNDTQLIGVGGTVTTLCAMSQGLNHYDPKKIHDKTVYIGRIEFLISKLTELSIAKRKILIPFDPKRADIILTGLVILRTIMEHFNIKKITVSDRGLLYGLALIS